MNDGKYCKIIIKLETLMFKNIQESDIECEFKNRSFTLCIKSPESVDKYSLII